MMHIRAALLLGLACASASAWGDSPCHDLPATAKKVEWIGEDMMFNGMRLRTAIMTFSQPASVVRDAFMRHWRERGAATRVTDDGKMVLLSAIDQRCSYTLQMLSGVRTEVIALFGAVNLAEEERSPMPRALSPTNNYPLPQGKIVADMFSRDGGNLARSIQLVLSNTSVRQATTNYGETLRRQGWRLLAAGASTYRHINAPGYALAAQKDGYRLDASFSNVSGEPTVFINVAFTER